MQTFSSGKQKTSSDPKLPVDPSEVNVRYPSGAVVRRGYARIAGRPMQPVALAPLNGWCPRAIADIDAAQYLKDGTRPITAIP